MSLNILNCDLMSLNCLEAMPCLGEKYYLHWAEHITCGNECYVLICCDLYMFEISSLDIEFASNSVAML